MGFVGVSLFNYDFFFSSSVQHECIPQAILGMDILCQAKSGMGKTAVFVLATLQQIEPVDGQVRVFIQTLDFQTQTLLFSHLEHNL